MAEKEAGSANKKIIIIAVVAVLIIAIAAGVAVYMIAMSQPEPKEELFYYSPGEAFITNLNGTNSLVKADMEIAYNEKKAAEDLTANNAVIRNGILFVLRNKTKEQLTASDVETTLSNEICQKLNNELGVSYFVKIYFKDLVVQG